MKSEVLIILLMVFLAVAVDAKHRQQPPPPPTTAIASVSWSPVVGATSYIVKMGTSSGVYNKQVVALGNSTTISGLSTSGTYYFAVQASAVGTNGPLSCEVAVTVPGSNSCKTP